jgi:D-xylonolactonase
MVGGFTIQENGSLLLFSEACAVYEFNGYELRTVLDRLEEAKDLIFNDVIADPLGGVFCGTKHIDLGPGKTGDLYYLNPKGQIKHLISGVKCANGLAFTPDLQKLYFTDSWAMNIYQFNYDKQRGTIADMCEFIKARSEDEHFDGMTIDNEGFFWSAIWGGGCIVRFDPSGREVSRIELPAVRVTSLTFGGDEYEDIFVTTAGGDDRQNFGLGAGALFRVSAGIKGIPEYRSRVVLP